MYEQFAIAQPHFFFDDEDKTGEVVVVMIMYCYLNTKNPMFAYNVAPTLNTKIKIYE